MPDILSSTMPDTVQLIVEVAGLCSRAPALEVIRPAGIAPRLNAHRNFSYHSSLLAGISTSAKALATRIKESSISLSTCSPCFDFKRYFLSQISSETS